MSERRKRNSSKVNLVISAVFHVIIGLGLFYLAAREGYMGKSMKTLVATLEQKPKVETPKPKIEPKIDIPKPVEQPKTVAVAPVPQAAPPPASTAAASAPPAFAPPAAELPAFDFSGGKEVQEVSDPKVLYKGLIESALRSRWFRPEDIADETYVAEVELMIDPQGRVTGSRWLKSSGDRRWDDSVKAAVASVKVLSQPPPKGFPGHFLARFDVELLRTEEVLKLSSR